MLCNLKAVLFQLPFGIIFTIHFQYTNIIIQAKAHASIDLQIHILDQFNNSDSEPLCMRILQIHILEQFNNSDSEPSCMRILQIHMIEQFNS